jgi:LuxR family maltose regulon positive regulatory protein
LPPAYLEQTPWTNLAFARALLLRGRIAQVAPLLQQAEAAAPASDQALRGEIEAFRAALAGVSGRAAAALEHARRALAMLPADNVAAQTLAQFALAGALRESGDASAAAGAYNQVIALSRAARLPLLEMLARAHLGFLHLLRGQLRQGAEIARPAVAGDALYPAAAPVYAALGEIYLEWNRLDEAEKLIDKALALAQESGHNATAARCHLVRCRLLMAQGDADAHRAVEEAEVHFEQGAPAWLWPLLHNQQARYWLAQDDPAMAAHLLAEATEDVPAHVGDILLLAWARLYVHQKQRREAGRLLDEAAETAVSQGHNGILLEALLLRALLQARSGDPAAAQADLRRALELAEAGGYVLLFREAGPEAAALLAAASHPYAKTLLAAFPEAMRRGKTAVSPLPEPLTERESEVLHRMAAGLTYQQIADDLVVSVNTVRHHVKGLYGKLQVSSRAQAVAQARALGLLDA